jgi:hypothetical protein
MVVSRTSGNDLLDHANVRGVGKKAAGRGRGVAIRTGGFTGGWRLPLAGLTKEFQPPGSGRGGGACVKSDSKYI